MPRNSRGVFYNILESDYPFTVGELKFYFSSPMNREKFMKRYQDELVRFNESAMNIYKGFFNLDFWELALVRLYTLIEKRGFYVVVRGETVTCRENLIFHLVTSVDPN
jgi:hypothetical protein